MDYNSQETAYYEHPNNYKTWSIINLVVSIVFCCSCCGIISLGLSIYALMKSNEVDNSLRMGKAGYAIALEASQNAKTFNIVSPVLLVLNAIGSVIYMMFYGFSTLAQLS